VDLLVPVTQYPNVVVFYHLAQAYLAAGEPVRAAAAFETVINHRGWPEWEVFFPLSQLGLARAYVMQGDRGKSRKAYDDFFNAWKGADPDIPILRQAKGEYRKLTAGSEPLNVPRASMEWNPIPVTSPREGRSPTAR
jgi:predicted Zn-dependent protease